MTAALLTTILFALSAVCATRSTQILGAAAANFFRISLATVLLTATAVALGQKFSSAAWPVFFLSGLIGYGIGDLALYQALPRLGSRLSIMLVHCLAAPLAATVEWAWLGLTLQPAHLLWGAIILAGVALALAPHEWPSASRQTRLCGALFGSIAAAGQGLGAVLSRRAYQVAETAGEPLVGFSGGIVAAAQRIVAGWLVITAFFLISRWLTPRNPAPPTVPQSLPPLGQSPRIAAWPWVLGNALAGPSLGVACFQWALASHPTGVVLPIVAMTPLAVIPMARWTENERPSLRSLCGGIVGVVGVVGLTLTRSTP